MHFAYLILSTLYLLNMGVDGAAIPDAVTVNSSTVQVRRIVYDRQFHNADFLSSKPEDKNTHTPVARPTRHSTRQTANVTDNNFLEDSASSVAKNATSELATPTGPSEATDSETMSNGAAGAEAGMKSDLESLYTI